MLRLSVNKTRWLFIGFFLALMIPSAILSYNAHEQLRWQAFHQYQLDAQTLVQQIDSVLSEAIDKEEARSDTDYTFFVLAGTPEAKFVQRSELSKFPVESDIAGVIGYFQIDEAGIFSSPILPSEHVQSSVHPGLYGISVEENAKRSQLVQSVRQVLSQNQLVGSQNSASDKADKGLAQESVVVTGSRIKSNQGKSSFGYSLDTKTNTNIAEEDSFQPQLETEKQQDNDLESDRLQEKKLSDSQQQRLNRFARLEQSNDRRRLLEEVKKDERLKKAKSKKSSRRMQTLARSLKQKQPSRKKRTEKNYSPQQSLAAIEQPEKRLAQKEIQIKLFESEIEPFKFSLLESGHFVFYRQVWRNNKRMIQGAILSAETFLDNAIKDRYQQSPLKSVARLSVLYAGESVAAFGEGQSQNTSYRDDVAVSRSKLQGEVLSVLNLSEPFSQISLDFRVIQMPASAGASFIKLVAGSLLLVLILGTYFLYRLTLKQTSLVQQQQDFVSSVSHELKTPLTSIRMYGEILKQGWVSEQKREEYYDYIYTESERLSRLIANVLQISKVSHNALDLSLISVEIPELVSLIKSKVDSQVSQSQFEMQIMVDPQIEHQSIAVDADAFVQIIINLVDNAIKYAASAETKQINIRFDAVGHSRVSVSVRDFGPGISRSHIKHVFELFYRSGNELTREAAGTGIGLALVKELALAMDAKIEAVNRQPGAEFSLQFLTSK